MRFVEKRAMSLWGLTACPRSSFRFLVGQLSQACNLHSVGSRCLAVVTPGIATFSCWTRTTRCFGTLQIPKPCQMLRPRLSANSTFGAARSTMWNTTHRIQTPLRSRPSLGACSCTPILKRKETGGWTRSERWAIRSESASYPLLPRPIIATRCRCRHPHPQIQSRCASSQRNLSSRLRNPSRLRSPCNRSSPYKKSSPCNRCSEQRRRLLVKVHLYSSPLLHRQPRRQAQRKPYPRPNQGTPTCNSSASLKRHGVLWLTTWPNAAIWR